MTERLLVIAAVCAVAVVVAVLARRRPPDAPVRPSSFSAPAQLDRSDFPRPETPWLVALFTSETCDTCTGVRRAAVALESDQVAVVDVDVEAAPELHARYGIEAVPICVVVDADGVTRASFIGAVSATHLWGVMAELRSPGSIPPGCVTTD